MRLLVTLAIVMLMSHARAEAQHTSLRAQRSDWIVHADDGWDEAALLRLLHDDDEAAVAGRSWSVGSAHAGTLAGAVRLPSHIGYAVREPSRAWGTSRAIDWLVQAFDFVVAADPGAPRVRVHDLSLRYGGPMSGHKSHQSGRDVDITYYQRSCHTECLGRPVAASELDAGRQWRLLRYWLQHGHAEFIFVDYALQRPLYDQAKSAGATPRQLAQWFQYPRGPAFPAGVIRHVPNHANHVHVRFRCPQPDRACTQTKTGPVFPRGRTAPSNLFELIESEAEDHGLLDRLEDSVEDSRGLQGFSPTFPASDGTYIATLGARRSGTSPVQSVTITPTRDLARMPASPSRPAALLTRTGNRQLLPLHAAHKGTARPPISVTNSGPYLQPGRP